MQRNVEALTLWRDELLSGRHEQGKFRLKTTDGKKCCLGVAAELFKDELGLQWRFSGSENSYALTDGITSSCMTLPLQVRAYLGITVKEQIIFTTYNDTHDYNFKQIASVVDDLIQGKDIVEEYVRNYGET